MTELFLIAIGLSMDAFAVSIAKGLTMKQVKMRDAALVGAWFGAFQCLMPLLGAWLGTKFLDKIQIVDHWVAFGILAAVGGNMIREVIKEGQEEKRQKQEAERRAQAYTAAQVNETALRHRNEEVIRGIQGYQTVQEIRQTGESLQQTGADLRISTMLLLALATSMDALAVGITFSLLKVRIVPASLFIGCVTFCISVGGVYAGRFLGEKVKKGASIAGGAVLILIGVKILLEHLGIV